VYKELLPVKKEQVDLENAFAWIPDSKTSNGIAEAPMTDLAVETSRDQKLRDLVYGCSRATRILQVIRRV
jgi:hypothetical protein